MTCWSYFWKYDDVTKKLEKHIYSNKTDLFIDPFPNNVISSKGRWTSLLFLFKSLKFIVEDGKREFLNILSTIHNLRLWKDFEFSWMEFSKIHMLIHPCILSFVWIRPERVVERCPHDTFLLPHYCGHWSFLNVKPFGC